MKIEELLELLVCPKCHGKLQAVALGGEAAGQGLACEPCKLVFALDDGLPNMLISDAQAWPPSAAAT